jgi:Coenzyme PQQ synthesis protein D (PqqD)
MPKVHLSRNVVHRSFGAEMVLLNLDTGQYHGLRGSGGRIFELLDETGDLEESARRIATELNHPLDEVRRDIDELCRALAERSLLVIEAE